MQRSPECFSLIPIQVKEICNLFSLLLIRRVPNAAHVWSSLERSFSTLSILWLCGQFFWKGIRQFSVPQKMAELRWVRKLYIFIYCNSVNNECIISFPCPPGIHSEAPAPGLIYNYARSGWDLCLGQIIPHLFLWEFHILFRNIWQCCLSQMGYWVRHSLDHMKICSQTWLFLKGLLKLLIQHSLQIYPSREAVPACKKREALALSQAAFRSLGSSLPQPNSLQKPKLLLNQLNSRKDVLRAATSPISITRWSMAAEGSHSGVPATMAVNTSNSLLHLLILST